MAVTKISNCKVYAISRQGIEQLEVLLVILSFAFNEDSCSE